MQRKDDDASSNNKLYCERVNQLLSCLVTASSDLEFISSTRILKSPTAASSTSSNNEHTAMLNPINPFEIRKGETFTITIGGITLTVKRANNAEYVPFFVWHWNNYNNGTNSNITSPRLSPFALDCSETIAHLRWMAQKEALNQDIFLIGPPGPLKRWLAYLYCALTQRECEYVALTRDTSESDLKQRREILEASAQYIDLCAVSAAIHGRVLILEGIEKCERNVLPVLNNLLENREMMLEDGRFLVQSKRYDELLKTNSKQQLDRLRLVRVSPDFRVISLALPVPRYAGNPLDPPLRSRFQCRDITSPPIMSQLRQFARQFSHLPKQQVDHLISVSRQILGFSEAIQTLQYEQGGDGLSKLPAFPTSSIFTLLQIVAHFPDIQNVTQLICQFFPFTLMCDPAEQAAIHIALQHWISTADASKIDAKYKIRAIHQVTPEKANLTFAGLKNATIVKSLLTGQHEVHADVLSTSTANSTSSTAFIELDCHHQTLVHMAQAHFVGVDICLVGRKGTGKSSLVKRFSKLFGYYPHTTMHLYQDMSARDLLQRRNTNSSGDTRVFKIWENSALLHAAKEGGLVVLDGVDRLHSSTFAILQSLIIDREITLFDGTRMVRWDRYNIMAQHLSQAELKAKRISCVHPSFRIIAIGNLNSSSTQPQWVTSEVLPLFSFEHVAPLPGAKLKSLLSMKFPSLSVTRHIEPLLALQQLLVHLITTVDENDTVGEEIKMGGFSLRQLIRICKRWSAFNPKLDWNELKIICAYIPSVAQETINELLKHEAVLKLFPKTKDEQLSDAAPLAIVHETDKQGNKIVTIGNTSAKIQVPAHPALVPQIVFHPMPLHIILLQRMMRDFVVGEHLLLIGPQGVGKNVLTDKFLQLLKIEREYIQLHRDTTVQSLTLSPSLKDGVILWEDSPLVKAVKHGRCLVVDEADKAPLEVVCILKGLVEDGEMLLSDGRRILQDTVRATGNVKTIAMHPNFKMIVLANKQGFPFLGNDLLAELGDCFSCHQIDNPDVESERSLLKFYGPSVADHVLERLTLLFKDLRSLVDQGLLSYPYSTRELVSIVKHLEKYPQDGLIGSINNVFSFDGYDHHLITHLTRVFHRHGIPVGIGTKFNIKFGKQLALPTPSTIESWNACNSNEQTPIAVKCEQIVQKGAWTLSGMDQWVPLSNRKPVRINTFTEEKFCWTLASDSGEFKNIVESLNGDLHTIKTGPFSLVSFGPTEEYSLTRSIDLTKYLRYNIAIMAHGDAEAFPFPISLHSLPKSNKLLIYIPAFFLALLIDLRSGEVGALVINTTPTGGDGLFAVYNSTTYLGHNKRGRRAKNTINSPFKPQIIASKDEDVFVFSPKSNHFVVCDFQQMKQYRMTLEAPFNEVVITKFAFVQNNLVLLTVLPNSLPEELLDERVFDASTRVLLCEMNINTSSARVLKVFERHELSPKVLMPTIRFDSANGILNYSTYTTYANNLTHDELCNNQQIGISSYVRMQKANQQPKFSMLLHNSNQQVNLIKNEKATPRSSGNSDGDNAPTSLVKQVDDCYQLEIIDFDSKKMKIIDLPPPLPSLMAVPSRFHSQLSIAVNEIAMNQNLDIIELSNGNLATLQFCKPPTNFRGHVGVESRAVVKIWEVQPTKLSASLEQWKSMLGNQATPDNLRVTIDYDRSKESMGPKEGKIDGKEHHGGNTFHGGTGGVDTPGLGGKGGSRRADGGYDVYQISESEKKNMSERVQNTRKAMAKEMFLKRLKQIDMSEYDSTLYEKFYSRVSLQIGQLRTILQSVRAKQKERVWLKNKQSGEVDDMKLVDGLVGEKNVYKHRGEVAPSAATLQQKPKRLKFVMDCSGSMYRFNGQDQRLDRLMEVMCMIMESFQGYESKYSYSVVGHSGDGPSIPFIDYDKPPATKKERLQIMQKMQAHSEYCSSGDSTVEALYAAVKEIVKKEADDYFVFLVSDANLSRYSIHPSQLSAAMTQNELVNTFSIFVASLADEAQALSRELPVGKGFVCLDTSTLPAIFKQIFASTLLREKL